MSNGQDGASAVPSPFGGMAAPGSPGSVAYARGVASRVPLGLEIAARARRRRGSRGSRGRRRRHDAPGQAALVRSTRPRSSGWRRGSPQGAALVSATNGKTTTAAMAAEILAAAPPARAQRAPARTSSPGSPRPCSRRTAPSSGCFEVDEAALPEVAAASGRARSASATSSATSSTATASSSSSPRAGARGRGSSTGRATLVVNGDDPQVGDLAHERPGARPSSGSTTRATRGPALQHAADSKWCVRCGTPYEYAAAYVGHLGDYRCPACGHARPALDVAAREVELDGPRGGLVPARARRRASGACGCALPGLYNVYNALAAAALALALGARSTRSSPAWSASAPPSGASSASRSATGTAADAAGQEPGRRERGDADALAGGAPRLAVIALNDEIADGRDVSWIWDVDFEPLLDGLERRRGDRRRGRRSWRCASSTPVSPSERIEVEPDLERALDRGLALTPPGGELVVPADVHGDARAAPDRRPSAATSAPYWERAA